MVIRRFFLKSSGLALVSFGVAPQRPGAVGLRGPKAAGAARRRWWSSSSAAPWTASTSWPPMPIRSTARFRPTIALPAPRGGGQ